MMTPARITLWYNDSKGIFCIHVWAKAESVGSRSRGEAALMGRGK